MMEEQNQEKATATQHVKAADAAAPETGNGKKEDKGGGKKEKKTAKPLTPKQLQQRKKLMVYPLMGLLFLGSMWLIFAPSEERDVNRDTVGAFNADIPLPENDGIIGDKRKAYEQAQAERRQAEKVRSLEDFAFSEESDADGVEMELPDSEPEREPFRDYSGNGGGRSSVAAYRDINRKLGSFYEEPKVDGEKEELKRQVVDTN
jgi:conjugative transposon TraM protein